MRAALAIAFALVAAPALAAEISAVETPDHRPALLIGGPIVEGDQYAFEKVWASHPNVQAVILNSPGGLILPALRMGETIRRGGLATVVMPVATFGWPVFIAFCRKVPRLGSTASMGTTARRSP
jgi:hypothetical protein